MFRKVTVWDRNVLTKGSVIKLTGYSGYNDFTFKGNHYKVIKTEYDVLTIQAKNGTKYEIHEWEAEDSPNNYGYGVHVKMIEQAPVETIEIPF